jgi:3-oxoacyl-[acyl-carrier protein] reductase
VERLLREKAFAGETHIVTGAGQGIGLAVARRLAQHGAQLVLVDFDAGELAGIADEIAAAGAPRPIPSPGDVTDEVAVQATVRRALEATGCINGVVNVAGIARDARIIKKGYEEFKKVVGVHLYGTFLYMREVAVQHWHVLFKENDNQPLDDGVNRFVINFSSVSARNGNVGQIDYTAAKGAIESATKTAAREFASYRARVNAIAPGPVNTPMLAAVGEAGITAMQRLTLTGHVAEPDDIAATVTAIADPELFGYTTGQVFAANGGMYLD